jgi:hypothetical protein
VPPPEGDVVVAGGVVEGTVVDVTVVVGVGVGVVPGVDAHPAIQAPIRMMANARYRIFFVIWAGNTA